MNNRVNFASIIVGGRLPQWPQWQFRTAIFAGALSSATAFAGHVLETTGTLLGGAISADQQNIDNSSLMPMIREEANKDDAFSAAVLGGTGGSATLSVHACSGPPGEDTPYFVGIAQGGANTDYIGSFRVTSNTLPMGSPVFVKLTANGARRETLKLDFDPGSENVLDGIQVSGNGSINFHVGGASYLFAGSFNHSIDSFGNNNHAKSGLFDGQDAQDLMTIVGGNLQSAVVPALVGDLVTIGVAGELSAASGAIAGVTADGDAQLLLNWGVSPFESNIQIVSVTDPNQMAPNNSDLTLDPLLLLLPPRPPTVDTPEPSALALIAIGCIAGMNTRRRKPTSHNRV